MPQQLEPVSQEQSHTRNPREGVLRRLSRSPHPYHRQQFELPHGSERFSTGGIAYRTPFHLAESTDHDSRRDEQVRTVSYRESANSDSGTEADDEHFLKGLPAPKLRLHKGLRGVDGTPSGSPSPLLSPAILDDESHKLLPRKYLKSSAASSEDELWKIAEKFREKRKVEIVRRATEVGLLAFLGGLLCLDSEVRSLLWIWRKELAYQVLVSVGLTAVYPLRVLRYLNPSAPWKRPFQLALPSAFDPAPLLYPPILSMLVALVLFKSQPIALLPTIILGLSSLPKDIIPSMGGLQGSNTTQWLLSTLPTLLAKSAVTATQIKDSKSKILALSPEILILLPPLHQSLCGTLSYLTTTSLLPAELQLLSMSLINLLLLATSPQAIILKSLLWGGGIGVLVSCTHVLSWGVILARVPKWRFKRSRIQSTPREKSVLGLIRRRLSFGTSVFARNPVVTDSSEDDEPIGFESCSPSLKLTTTDLGRFESNDIDGPFSAIEPNSQANGFPITGGSMAESFKRSRRHTLSSLGDAITPKSSKRTPSGRKKRSASSVQSFFSLTPSQAAVRKWLYACYVYVCVSIIILGGIREYVGRYALSGNEPIGWALGYLFGDLPWFRMQVVSANLQRWICLPLRSGLEHQESCHKGWVEHLRHASFGQANTRLILCAYWLAIIIVGLAIVFRLSSIYEVDTRRKVFHFMMVAMLLPATYVDPAFAALALSLMLAIFLLLDLFRASQLPPLSKSLAYFLTPYVDGRDLKGPVVISHIFLLIGCAIPLWLSLASLPRTGSDYLAGWEIPSREVSMVSGVICVGMGDAAASLIGRRYGRRKWLWGGGKSIEGSVAFATAVGLALMLAKLWLRIGGWPANNDDSWFMTVGKVGVAGWAASLTEAVLTGGNDNVVVPVVLWLCAKGLDI